MKIYGASKVRHADYWKRLRGCGNNIISTWIDESRPRETRNKQELARRCIEEIKRCDFVLLYIEEGDEPKGAFIEVGAALGFGKHVKVVAPTYRIGLFEHHYLVSRYPTMADVLSFIPHDHHH